MQEDVGEHEGTDTEGAAEEALRRDLYDQFDISPTAQIGIRWILPLLDAVVDTGSRYDIDMRSKILAEIALYQAYNQQSKIKIFALPAALLVVFDFLHSLNTGVYSVVFIALATINGFLSTLRSPVMMAAELEGVTDEDGMPADYRAKAFSSVNTNITLVLFVIGAGVQLLVTGGIVQGEIVARNVADGRVTPVVSGIVLLSLSVVYDRVRGD